MKHVMRAAGIQTLILLLYFGAIGPIACLEWNGVALNSGLYDAAVVAYKPVDWVCERSETISDIHDGWVRCLIETAQAAPA